MAIHEKTNTAIFKVIVCVFRNTVYCFKTGVSQQLVWPTAKF